MEKKKSLCKVEILRTDGKGKGEGWKIHRFTVYTGGEMFCVGEAIKMSGSLFLWLGGRDLGSIALGVPGDTNSTSLATLLTGEGDTALNLSRRLATALKKPVFVCCSLNLDRFTQPLLEKALITEIKSRPDVYSDSMIIEIN